MTKFDLQLFKGSTTSTTTYTASPEERALLAQELKIAEAYEPNILNLNNTAASLLQDSYGTVQADYDQMNNQAQNQISTGNQLISDAANGVLPSSYTQNMTDAIQSGVTNTVGNAINTLGNRGVLNSSVTNQAMNDISSNVADTMAQNYTNNISTVSGLGQQMLDNSGVAISTSAAAQEAAQQPALNLWNASLGLSGNTNSTLSTIAGKYGTSKTTSSTSGNGLSSLLGGITSLGSGYLTGLGSRSTR